MRITISGLLDKHKQFIKSEIENGATFKEIYYTLKSDINKQIDRVFTYGSLVAYCNRRGIKKDISMFDKHKDEILHKLKLGYKRAAIADDLMKEGKINDIDISRVTRSLTKWIYRNDYLEYERKYKQTS